MSSSDEIVLYHSRFSRSYTAYWMLEELGRPFRVEITDIVTGAQKRPEFLVINPSGKVPALTDGGVVLTERCAICVYLADKYAYGTLAPTREARERADYLKWMFYAAGVLEPATTLRRFKLEVPARDAGWGDYDTMVSILSRALENREFIVGNSFSAADVVLGSIIQYALFNSLLPRVPALSEYGERLAMRPAAKKAVEATWGSAG